MPGRGEDGARMGQVGRRCPWSGRLARTRQTSCPAEGLEPEGGWSLENRSRFEDLRTLPCSSRPGQSRADQLEGITEERSAAGDRPAYRRGGAVALMQLFPWEQAT